MTCNTSGGRGLLFERLAQGLLALLALGHVADRADQANRPAARIAHRQRMVLDPAILAAAEPDAVFAAGAVPPRLSRRRAAALR